MLNHFRMLDVVTRAEYIPDIDIHSAIAERRMTKAKLFMTGGSQAVRLPAEFRFEESEVDIRRDPVTGDVILSKPRTSWDEYFDWARTLGLPDDFLENRDQPNDDLRERLPALRRKRG
jgi:antitoxin VapB